MRKISFLLLISLLFIPLWADDINWLPSPVTISTLGQDSAEPRIAMDSSGNVIAIWNENGVIKSSSLPFNGSWSAISTVSNSGASQPQLAVDPVGNATAVWIENNLVKAATMPSGGNWSAITTLSNSGASAPSLAVDTAGNIAAVWVLGGTIQASIKTFGGNWPLALSVSTLSSGTNNDNPQIAMSASGTVMAVWHNVVSGTDAIQSASQLLGGVWGTAKTVVQATFNHNYPKIALDANGNATVLWYRFIQSGSNYTNVFVVYSMLPSGGTSWSVALPLNLSAGMGNPAAFTARLAYDPSGNLIALWNISYNGASYNVEGAVRPIGGIFNPIGSLQCESYYALSEDIAVNALGEGIAITMAFNGMNLILQSAEVTSRPPTSNGWSFPVTVSAGGNNGYPRIVSTLLNNTTIYAAAVWINTNGLNNVIQASTGSRSTTLPPSNVAASQNMADYGLYKEYYNTITWSESKDPKICQYALFRNGVLFARVDQPCSTYVDRNAVQNATVTYGVIAIDTNSAQSAMASYTLFP